MNEASLNFWAGWIVITLFGLVFTGPPFVLIVYGSVRMARWLRAHHERWFDRVLFGAVIAVILTALGVLAKVETVSLLLDFALCALAYFAYCFVAATALTLEPRRARIATAIAAYAWLLPISVLVTLLSLSHLGEVRPPAHAEQIRPGLSCEVIEWGFSFGEEGYTVYVYRYLPAFPLLRDEVASVDVFPSEPQREPRSATCAGVARSL